VDGEQRHDVDNRLEERTPRREAVRRPCAARRFPMGQYYDRFDS